MEDAKPPAPRPEAALRARWAAALRSGDYAQGTGTLRRGDRFCCLGVLCDIYDRTRWIDPLPGCTHTPYREKDSDSPELAVLSRDVQEAAGLDHENVTAFVYANDKVRKSFLEIADIIEALPLP